MRSTTRAVGLSLALMTGIATLSLTPAVALAATSASAPSPATPPTAPAAGSTPNMGWNTYYGLGGDFDADEVLAVADSLRSTGLAAAGYDIVWLDGGWTATPSRTPDGTPQADPARFPQGMAALTAAIHAKGLRAGIYTDAGPDVPGSCALGSQGHEQQDADTFAAWGFDAVKVDFLCGIAANVDPKTEYTKISAALARNASGRPMLLNICNPVTSPDWGNYPESQQSTNTWTYAPAIAQSWRTYTDVGFQGAIKYSDVLRNFDANARHPESVSPGHFGDPDYLGPQLGMTDEEFRTQLALWAVSAAPLIIGSDPRTLSAASLEALTDRDVVAIDQDRLGRQGTRVGPAGTTETWVKPLADGSRAVVLLNRGDTAATVSTTGSAIGLGGGRLRVADAWTDAVTESRGTLRASVPAHGTALLRVTPARGLPTTPRIVVGTPTVTAVDGAPVSGPDLLVAPGSTLRVTVRVDDDGLLPVRDVRISFGLPAGWSAAPLGRSPSILLPGVPATWNADIRVPASASAGVPEATASLAFKVLGSRVTTVSSAPLRVVIAPPAPTGTGALSQHPWVSATSGWMTPAVDQSVGGGPISVSGTTHAHGIGVASPSEVRYFLGGACTRLSGAVGIDDAVKNVGPEGGTATFAIVGDGRTLYSTGTVVRDQEPSFDVDLTGIRDLRLQVGDAGDGGYNDRADWTELTVTCR